MIETGFSGVAEAGRSRLPFGVVAFYRAEK
jgi:hypothetical protein